MVKVVSTGGLPEFTKRDATELYGWDEPAKGPTKAEIEERLRKERERVNKYNRRKRLLKKQRASK